MEYKTFKDDLNSHFNTKVYKISLDVGTTCPTRDGTKGFNGCYYCGDTGSFFVKEPPKSILDQIIYGKNYIGKLYNATKFIAYLQAFTPTYLEPQRLDHILTQCLQDPDIVGLDIATRPDCLDFQKLQILAKHMIPRYHWLELGLESSHNQTLNLINRGHSYEDFLQTYQKAKKIGLRICVHVILGLPGETLQMMQETIHKLIDLKIDGIKFHNLYIVKNSIFENWYKEKKLHIYELDEYKEILKTLIQKLPNNIIIHRLIGDAPTRLVIAPQWIKSKLKALQAIEKHLKSA